MSLKIVLITVTVGVLVPSMAQAMPNLTSSQLQRISRDLVPSRSQEFFRQGQVQLEREVRQLERKKTSPVLKVDPALRERLGQKTSKRIRQRN
jgi:hypothetical protein